MNPLLHDNLNEIRALCQKHSVAALHVFGSVVTDAFNAESDVDFLVSFKPMDVEDYADTYFDLAEELEATLNRPVDLITEQSMRNPYFIKSVQDTKQLLYSA